MAWLQETTLASPLAHALRVSCIPATWAAGSPWAPWAGVLVVGWSGPSVRAGWRPDQKVERKASRCWRLPRCAAARTHGSPWGGVPAWAPWGTCWPGGFAAPGDAAGSWAPGAETWVPGAGELAVRAAALSAPASGAK